MGAYCCVGIGRTVKNCRNSGTLDGALSRGALCAVFFFGGVVLFFFCGGSNIVLFFFGWLGEAAAATLTNASAGGYASNVLCIGTSLTHPPPQQRLT